MKNIWDGLNSSLTQIWTLDLIQQVTKLRTRWALEYRSSAHLFLNTLNLCFSLGLTTLHVHTKQYVKLWLFILWYSKFQVGHRTIKIFWNVQ